MGRLFGTLGSLFAYLCMGTVIALAVILAYAATHGYLDRDKLARMADIARGIEVAQAPVEQTKKTVESPEQPSFDDIERQRGVKARNLELREAAVEQEMKRIYFEQNKLTDFYNRYELLRKSFNDAVLDTTKKDAIKEGEDKIRVIWENMKPKQAKDQILTMIDDGEINQVVSILSSVATQKQKKIIAEFKEPEEVKKLNEIMRLLRHGVPDVLPVDDARDKLRQFPKSQPSTNP